MIERLIEIIAEQFGVDADNITPDTNFKEDLGADSVDLAELAMTLDDEFDLPEPQDGDALPEFNTVNDALKYLEQFTD
ncbi:MAG: acyl carrier protein [Oscillospiraceae bacterium]|jgi:acyl carrier protein|nr:acyl carrier protein [Oscillospiraceae bacterium]